MVINLWDRIIAEKKNAYVKGRGTWLDTGENERTNPNIVNVVVSKSLL